ncbi:hypothetical protein NPX13_g2325 [Xylaria arbuscula]|uniref:Uncharacterized protein n=1 Tax=Xylaria arbuscula TaxID=114810 RepID=A0A9W8NJE7_9PEZI|nr:hypothetical protein NPX13_g2325 [Xylaria arbuscula]
MTGSGEGLARNTTTATITTTTTTTAAAAAPAAVETGYVGNLTPDQEKKLQQLWRLLLAAFDFDGSRLYHHADEESTTLPPPSQESKGSSRPQTKKSKSKGKGKNSEKHGSA